MLLAGSTSLLRSVGRCRKQLRLLASLGFSELIAQLTRCGFQYLQRDTSSRSSSAPVLIATH